MDEDELDVSFGVDDPDEAALNETMVSTDMSLVSFSSASFGSDKSVGEEVASSTPTKNTRKSRNNVPPPSEPGPFKKPDAPKFLATCPTCKAKLKTASGFYNHQLAHKWKELASKQVPCSELKELCLDEGTKVLELIAHTDYPGRYGQEMKKLASAVSTKKDSPECHDLLESVANIIIDGLAKFNIRKQGAAFPSAIRVSFLEGVSINLSNKEFCDNLIEKLIRIELCPTTVAYPYILELYRQLGSFALVRLFQSFGAKDSALNVTRSKDDFSNILTHKVVYHIAGSTVRSMLRNAYRYRHNAKLSRMKDCILKKIAKISPPDIYQENDKEFWTYQINRKSLMFVNECAFSFFLELAYILQKLERPDGSLGHEAVMEVVVSSPNILCRWDEVISCELCEEESFSFMVKVIRTFTNTYGRGVLLRRMNKLGMKGKGLKATTSVSHRAKLL